MSTDPVIVYGSDRLGTLWNVVDTAHPNGHRGTDWHLPDGGGSFVPAYERCVVKSTPFSPILGFCTVVQYADGRFGYWAHLRKGTRPNVNTVLNPGDRVGLAASGPKPTKALTEALAGADYPGTAWEGCHIHHGTGPLLSSVFSGVTYDPLPRVRQAIYALAGSDFTPINQEEGFLMALSDTEQRELLNKVRDLFGAVGAGQGVGTSADSSVLGNARNANANAAAALAAVKALPTAEAIGHQVWWVEGVDRGRRDADGNVLLEPMRQELADAKSNVLALLANGGIDAKKLAADIAAQITPASGATAADVEAAVTRALARVFVTAN